MGVISSALNSALENLGRATMDVGNNGLLAGYNVWQKCCDITVNYLQINPVTVGGSAWRIVTGGLFNLSMGIAASLSILFFVIGWLNESIDVRNNFTLENMFRFFIRYIITATLIVNSLAVVRGTVDCSTALVRSVNVETGSMQSDSVENIFEDLQDNLENEDANGVEWLGTGIISLIAGLFGGVVILVCGVQLILAVLSRLFKMYLCIPFAPVAFAGFASGHMLSQTGIAWIRTFLGYCLEAVVMAIAIRISFGLFADGSVMVASQNVSGALGAILTIVEYCLPMITACACVKGAEATIRRCLGLG